jgi:signal transduction histidine kinase
MNRRLVSILLSIYLIAVSLWWAYDLWHENEQLYQAELNLIKERHVPPSALEFKAVEDGHKSRRLRVLIEGFFFTAGLAAGIFLINKTTKKEVKLTQQRRNFILSITHELKSPVAALRLALETIGRRELPHEKVEILCKNAMRDANRLQSLVEDLLLAAQLEDNWQPNQEPLDLHVMAEQCVSNLRIRFPKANILLDIPQDLSTTKLDQKAMTSVVHNLLENALKYSPESSLVAFKVSKLDKKLRIQISDQGKGIPLEAREAVFEKFYRLGNEETRQATGTGLGLYIAKQVVKAHGGTIEITDNQPNGTIFTIEL